MTENEPDDRSDAERAGIVDQQDAALAAMSNADDPDESEPAPDDHHDPDPASSSG